MRTYRQQTSTSHAVDQAMLSTLKRGSAQNEALLSLTGIGWALVVLSVDRLSRMGRVSLRPVRPVHIGFRLAGLLHR